MVFCGDINKAFAELQEQINNQLDAKNQRIDFLEKRVEHLESEQFKDDEIKRLQQENKELSEDYWRGFPITKKEKEAIDNWWKKHRKEKHNGIFYTGTIGGGLEYRFLPTGIGTYGEVVCHCGEKFCFCELL